MQIAFVGFQPVQSSEHMAALGVFGLCQLFAFYEYTRSKLSADQFQALFKSLSLIVITVFGGALTVLTITGS
jgi:dolichyl-diphosphooligosaccharide--protein glycosyltransferase